MFKLRSESPSYRYQNSAQHFATKDAPVNNIASSKHMLALPTHFSFITALWQMV
ncbi:hypothetical protein CFter6_0456 [Collimonas fungivorans]|uniref:Uncharacterized protein n=1 Tax=Collimonas fungivorans TaxID=158899 RepID=A0A127P622_9BURK|nr:hypothetical protein CFter6_0456 [Collimonas fungivorans]